MPSQYQKDHQLTKQYMPNLSDFCHSTHLAHTFSSLQSRCFHEGRVVQKDIKDYVYIKSMFENIGFDCLLNIKEDIYPRFLLEFFSTYSVIENNDGIFVRFILKDQLIQYSLEVFGQILDVPFVGTCRFTDKWKLSALLESNNCPPNDHEEIDLDFIVDIVSKKRNRPVNRSLHTKVRSVKRHEVLLSDLNDNMVQWTNILRENVFCLGGNRDHVPACLVHMLYCIFTNTNYNLAYFIAQRINYAIHKPKTNLPYAILLTRLFKRVGRDFPNLDLSQFQPVKRVMLPIQEVYKRKTRCDRKSDQQESNDEDMDMPTSDGDGIGTSAPIDSSSSSHHSTNSFVDGLDDIASPPHHSSSEVPNNLNLEELYRQNLRTRGDLHEHRIESRKGIKYLGKMIKDLGKKRR